MNAEVRKGKPLSKEETMALLILIGNDNIITSKCTNAATNRLKAEAWEKLTYSFNTRFTKRPRTSVQLRAKWDNLKKTARKRGTDIKMNSLETGGGSEEVIPQDEILDFVASILDNKVSSVEVPLPFGGDQELEQITLVKDENIGDTVHSDVIIEYEDPLISDSNESLASLPKNVLLNCDGERRKRMSFTNPRTGKRKLLHLSKQKRDKAITEYYNLKKICLEANLKNIQLQNEKLKLELEILKNKSQFLLK